MALINEVGPSEARPDLLGSVAMNLGVCPRALPKPELHRSDVYCDILRVRWISFHFRNRIATRRPRRLAVVVKG